jgi:hypothetical protein
MVLTQTELHQLFKLPILVEHFKEHQALNRDITVLYFLKEHYICHTEIDNDYQRDMQLPFKTTDFVNAIAIACEEPAEFDLDHHVEFITREFNVLETWLPRQGALQSIFQPPRTYMI